MSSGGGGGVPAWLDKADNAWQMTAAAMVGLQSVPGLVVLYGSVVKKKWAVNSAFMALYAFAATLLCWVAWAYRMAFGDKLLPIWGKAGPALSQTFLLRRASLPATAIAAAAAASSSSAASSPDSSAASSAAIPSVFPLFPMATMVFYQFAFAAIAVLILAGSLLGRMNLKAWMLFVPLWLTLSYTVGAFCLWGGGFLFHWGVLDYSGGYVIHLSSGVAGLVAAFWVGPRMTKDRERFPPNNVLLTLAGAGLLWLGWSGFNGGSGFTADIDSSLALLNTHICTATSLLVWTALDVLFFNKPSVIGAVQGMTTGLVCITPGAGLVQGWAAIVMGALSGSVPWFTMMVVHKKLKVLRRVDDTLAVFHTHAVAGLLGGLLTGLFADPVLCGYFKPGEGKQCGGSFYGRHYRDQIVRQLVGALFVAGWNLVMTSVVCLAIKLVVPLRMSVEELSIGDDAAHGEEAYALWYDEEEEEEEKLDREQPSDNFFIPMSNLRQQQADNPRARSDASSPKPNLPSSSTVHL